MADTRRTWSALATLLATNAAGAISAQDLRDFLASAQPHEATNDPGASDDGTDGYDLGSVWWNSSGEKLHVCVGNTTSAAVWKQVWPALVNDLDLTGVDVADLASGAATTGQVPTADGSGGVAWDDPAGGGSGNDYYDLELGFIGVPDAGGTDVILLPRALTIDDADPAVVHVGTNPTASADIDVQQNGSSVGTLTIATDGAASWTLSADIELAAGDLLALIAPSPADSTLADVIVAFKGTAT